MSLRFIAECEAKRINAPLSCVTMYVTTIRGWFACIAVAKQVQVAVYSWRLSKCYLHIATINRRSAFPFCSCRSRWLIRTCWASLRRRLPDWFLMRFASLLVTHRRPISSLASLLVIARSLFCSDCGRTHYRTRYVTNWLTYFIDPLFLSSLQSLLLL